MKESKIKMMAFPAFPGENPRMAGSAAGAIQVGYGLTRSGAENVSIRRAAVEFLNFINNEKNTIVRLKDGAIVAPILNIYTLPDDIEPILKEKVRFATGIKNVTNIIDAFLRQDSNDVLNAGIQDMALGIISQQENHMTPETIADSVEKTFTR